MPPPSVDDERHDRWDLQGERSHQGRAEDHGRLIRRRRLSIHGLRHTYASLSLMRGVPVEVVSKQLGHSSPAFTLSQYRWVYREERQAWALGLNDLLPPVTHDLRTVHPGPDD